ncbi:hypothetical protein J3B00_002224 [Pseudomonas sp. BP8]|nr:hypothetical protein [Pseudomonas sp. BP8]
MHENTEIRRVPKSFSCINNGINSSRFVVVPAGTAFFHVTDTLTGRVKGFRCRLPHSAARAQ